MKLDPTEIQQPTLTLDHIKAYLLTVVHNMDTDVKNNIKNGVPFDHEPSKIRSLLNLGRYDCLRELYYDIAGTYPSDEVIRSWPNKKQSKV